MKQNKRGISQVVATVLIIMITIVAISVMAAFIVPFVKNTLQKSTECMPYKSYYALDESFGYNCFDEPGGLYAVSVKASFDKDLAANVEGIKLVLNDRSGTNKVLDINGSAGSKSEGGLWVMGSDSDILRIPGPGGIVTYRYNASGNENFITAEVYPVLKSGRICADMKEVITLKSCEKPIQ